MLANVLDHGARGDDTAVDSAAFQAAIDAVGPGVVDALADRYRVTNLMLRSGQTLVGEGRGSVLVRAEQGPNGEPSGVLAGTESRRTAAPLRPRRRPFA